MAKKKGSTRQRPVMAVGSTAKWPAYITALICTLLLASGFFFAARQHFASMDFGMKNSKLRKQIDALEAEKRRLMLAREVSMAPAEIKKAAKKLGILEVAPSAVADVVPIPARAELPKTPEVQAKPAVLKTGSVKPVVDEQPKTREPEQRSYDRKRVVSE